jgi:galactokinase/mevalonate kinase-like predicted kinase
MLFICTPDKKERLSKAFADRGYIVVPMKLEFSGSTIMSLDW